MNPSKRLRLLVRCAGAVALALLVSGCVVVPVYPWHPHYGYWH